MSGKVDWKQKYYELRSKYMNAVDTAFRLGHEEGQREAEMASMQQQLAQMEEEAAMAAAGGGMVDENGMPMEEPMVDENGMPMEEGMPGEEIPGEEMGEEPSLDSSIDELESYVKNEKKSIDFKELMKSTHKMKTESIKESKNTKADKLTSIVDSFDDSDESAESTENGEIIGQA
jgi:hypothetical protein